VTTYTLADLGIDAANVGLRGAWSAVDCSTQRPPRPPGVVVTDEGDGGAKLAEFLTAGKFI
jgi:electron transfer flavoprotein beta subunit